MVDMCRFKDDELLAWTRKWLHEIPIFFCYLDSSDKANHWNKKDWSVRDRLSVGENNVIAQQLVPRGKIVFFSI